MNSEDYWVVRYKDGLVKKSSFHIIAPYHQYDKEKILKILNEIYPELDIVKITQIEKPKEYGG
jgi:hypothetical protein